MATLTVRDADDAVSGMNALRDVLNKNLEDVTQRINRLERCYAHDSELINNELVVYQTARTAILSGLASINEVLSWVRLSAVKDPEGNELDCVRSLPRVTVQRVN